MASSLIQINEATESDLQQLNGIGPKRASNICRYRSEVDPIRNTFDLAVAAGIGLKQARRLAEHVVFDPPGSQREISLWPVLLLALGSLWLIWSGLDPLVSGLHHPFAAFSFGLGLILTGALLLMFEISLESLNVTMRAARLLTVAGLLLLVTGFCSLVVAVISIDLAPANPVLRNTMLGSLNFFTFALLMTWLIYSPLFSMRLFMGEARESWLFQVRYVYDHSIFTPGILTALVILLNNTDTLLEEIFAIWCVALMVIQGKELKDGFSAFDAMLTPADRQRISFAISRSEAPVPESGYSIAALATWVVAALLVLLVAGSSWF